MRATNDLKSSSLHVGEEVESVTKFVYPGRPVSLDKNYYDDIKQILTIEIASFKRLFSFSENKQLSKQPK